jgi:hypothetical protein
MADAANAALHTPWDCRWSRFARRTRGRATTGEQTRGSLWECVHSDSRVPITEADCAACPFWEYQPTGDEALEQAKLCERAAKDRSARQIQGGIRVSLFVIAVTFAACGFIVLTEPLAVPFTITMWLGAAMSFMAGVFGNFRSHADGTFRGFLPPRG